MAHYQIYIPGKRGQNPQNLADVGLADFVDNSNWMDEPIGPDDNGGCLVSWPTPQQVAAGFGMIYQPDRQDWLPAVAFDGLPAGRYWIGFWKDADPTPDELARAYRYKGRKCQLGDGNGWLFPEPNELPSEMIRDDDGSWKFELQRRFHDYALDCDQWLTKLATSDDVTTINYYDVADFVEKSLRLNYRITSEVVNRLRLFTRDNIATPLLAVCGATALAESHGYVGHE